MARMAFRSFEYVRAMDSSIVRLEHFFLKRKPLALTKMHLINWIGDKGDLCSLALPYACQNMAYACRNMA
jgi:hypothetical protein